MPSVTVVYRVTFNTEDHGLVIDQERLDDDDYKDAVQEQIKEIADERLDDCEPIIHDSDYPELVE